MHVEAMPKGAWNPAALLTKSGAQYGGAWRFRCRGATVEARGRARDVCVAACLVGILSLTHDPGLASLSPWPPCCSPAEDMWHTYNLVREGDHLTATTFRKVQVGGAGWRWAGRRGEGMGAVRGWARDAGTLVGCGDSGGALQHRTLMQLAVQQPDYVASCQVLHNPTRPRTVLTLDQTPAQRPPLFVPPKGQGQHTACSAVLDGF